VLKNCAVIFAVVPASKFCTRNPVEREVTTPARGLNAYAGALGVTVGCAVAVFVSVFVAVAFAVGETVAVADLVAVAVAAGLVAVADGASVLVTVAVGKTRV